MVIEQSGAGCFLVGINDQNQHAEQSRVEHLRSTAFRQLLVELDLAGVTMQKRVRIVADTHDSAPRAHSQLAEYQAAGTPGLIDSRLDSIEAPILFMDSRHSSGLQAIDLVTYLLNRWHTVSEQHPKAQRAKERLWLTIQASFAQPRGNLRFHEGIREPPEPKPRGFSKG